MSKFNFKNQTGGASAKSILIVVSATLLAAVIIIIIFTVLSGRRTPTTTTADFLENIKKQRQNQESGGDTPAAVAPTAVAFTGVLTGISPATLVITETGTTNKITINFNAKTPITYNGQAFNTSQFYVGDQLEIIAKKPNNDWQAEAIIVLVSASPTTAKPIPSAPNVQPDGSIKSL